MKSYYNTTGLTSKKLAKEIQNAKSQQEIVWAFLNKNYKKAFTRSEISYILRKEFKVRIGRHEVGRCLSNMYNSNLPLISKLGTRISSCGVGKAEHEYVSIFNY